MTILGTLGTLGMRGSGRTAATAATLALTLAGALALPGTALARDCAADRVEGEAARYWHAGEWSPLGPGTGLPSGETIVETGEATRVEIVCSGGITLTVGVATRVNLERLTGPRDARSVILQLVEGVVGLIAPPGGWARFDVRAPLLIASVRSTEWLVVHEAGEGSAAFVRAGRVAVEPLAGSGRVVLAPGQGVDVSPGGPGPIKEWGQGRLDRLGARLGFGWR